MKTLTTLLGCFLLACATLPPPAHGLPTSITTMGDSLGFCNPTGTTPVQGWTSQVGASCLNVPGTGLHTWMPTADRSEAWLGFLTTPGAFWNQWDQGGNPWSDLFVPYLGDLTGGEDVLIVSLGYNDAGLLQGDVHPLGGIFEWQLSQDSFLINVKALGFERVIWLVPHARAGLGGSLWSKALAGMVLGQCASGQVFPNIAHECIDTRIGFNPGAMIGPDGVHLSEAGDEHVAGLVQSHLGLASLLDCSVEGNCSVNDPRVLAGPVSMPEPNPALLLGAGILFLAYVGRPR